MSTVTISIPSQIAKKVDEEARKQGFSTRSEFIRSLLRRYFVEIREEFEFEEFKQIPLEQMKLELAQTGKYSEKFIESVIEGFRNSSAYENKTS